MIHERVIQSPCALDSNAEPNSYCKPGDDITDPLLTSPQAAWIRGYNEIQKSFSNRIKVSGTTILKDWVAPGSLINCSDNQIGLYGGLLRSFSINITRENAGNATAVSNVVIERIAE